MTLVLAGSPPIRPISFPDVYTHFRVALEKNNVRVRRLANLPDTLKPPTNGVTSTPVPTLVDYGYPSTTAMHTRSSTIRLSLSLV